MQEFPPEIVRSMRDSGVTTTCVPVQVDGGDWESAVFFGLAGKACIPDREALRQCGKPLPITLEADIIETVHGAVVVLRFEIDTRPGDPLAGEVLLTPGAGAVQFSTLQHLTQQDSLRFYFADTDYQVIHSQQMTLGDRERGGYREILDDAVKYDAVIRLTGRYDARAAMKGVTSHYATRVAHPD